MILISECYDEDDHKEFLEKFEAQIQTKENYKEKWELYSKQKNMDYAPNTFKNIFEFIFQMLDKLNSFEKFLRIYLNIPLSKNYLYVPEMVPGKNQETFTGILSDDCSGSRGIGHISFKDNQILYYGQVIKKEEGILMHGYGKINNKQDQSKYIGKFKKGEITGFGIMKKKSKHNYYTYQGNLMNGKREGVGELITSKNKKYLGFWKEDNLVEGIVVEDKATYYGKFYDDKLNGEGFIKEKGNEISYGKWINGKLDCTSGFKFTGNDLYYGGWENGQQVGMGLYIDLKTLNIMRGRWKSGLKNDQMTLLSYDKLSYEIWDNNQFVKTIFSAKLDDIMISTKEEKKT